MGIVREWEVQEGVIRLFRGGATRIWCADLGSFCLVPPRSSRAHGYAEMTIDGKKELGHVLVWEAHNGPPPRGENGIRVGDVSHLCHRRECCNIEHLVLESRGANLRRSIARGDMLRGEANGQAVLTENAVRAIRSDPRSPQILAAEHGVTARSIRRIRQRQRWSHVT